MKTIETTQHVEDILTEEKKVEIIATINANWDEFYTKEELAHFIEQGYIYGPLGNNEHYLVSEILKLIDEVELEKNPLVIEEVIEETLIPIE